MAEQTRTSNFAGCINCNNLPSSGNALLYSVAGKRYPYPTNCCKTHQHLRHPSRTDGGKVVRRLLMHQRCFAPHIIKGTAHPTTHPRTLCHASEELRNYLRPLMYRPSSGQGFDRHHHYYCDFDPTGLCTHNVPEMTFFLRPPK